MVKDYIVYGVLETFIKNLRCELKLNPLNLHFQKIRETGFLSIKNC